VVAGAADRQHVRVTIRGALTMKRIAMVLLLVALSGCGSDHNPTSPGPVAVNDTEALLSVYRVLPVGSSYYLAMLVLPSLAVADSTHDYVLGDVGFAAARVELFGRPSTIRLAFASDHLFFIGYLTDPEPEPGTLESVDQSVNEFYATRLPRGGNGKQWIVWFTGMRAASEGGWGLGWALISAEALPTYGSQDGP
jgi:hypothetical protein